MAESRSIDAESVRGWRLLLEYEGTAYNGWQRQPNGVSVQAKVEDALWSVLGGERTPLISSGRTDAGVHALQMVCSFRTRAERTAAQLRDGINAQLPSDIAVLRAERVHFDFHARHSATNKLYRYVLRLPPGRSALRRSRVWQLRHTLDVAAMDTALQHLIGEHDFTSFRAQGCAASSPVRTIHAARCAQVGDEVHVELEGNGFLRYMVRNIVGSLVEVGLGRRDAAWFQALLERRDRRAGGRTAPPTGLHLVRVDYPAALLSPGEGR